MKCDYLYSKYYSLTTFGLHLQTIFQSIDHHWKDNVFATSGQQVDIWDEERTEPVRTFTWGVDSIHSVKFNPIEVRYRTFTWRVDSI